MKIRLDFVTNSSSSSFAFWGVYSKELVDFLVNMINNGYTYRNNEIQIRQNNIESVSLLGADGKSVDGYLTFIMDEKKKQAIGFQIEAEAESQDRCSEKDIYDVLWYFINKKSLPDSEATYKEFEKLVGEAMIKKQVLFKCDEGMTDSENLVFTYREFCETIFNIDNGVLVSCTDKTAREIISHDNGPIEAIGNCAFMNMVSLEDFRLNFNRDIGDNAFEGCSNLKHIDISSHGSKEDYDSKSVIDSSNIHKRAFAKCDALESISLETPHIFSSAFEDCVELKYVELNYEIEKIDANAFKNCVNLKDIYFPHDYYNFSDCSYNGIKSISPTAFKNCDNVVFHVYEGTYAHRYAIEHGISVEIKAMFPAEASVWDLRISRTKNFCKGMELIVNESSTRRDTFCIVDNEGQMVGTFKIKEFSTGEYVHNNFDKIHVTMKEIVPKGQDPNEKNPYMKVLVDMK